MAVNPPLFGVDDYYVDLINRLLGTGHYEWARPTLQGIATTIDTTHQVTPSQKEAIDHIIAGRLKHDIPRGPA